MIVFVTATIVIIIIIIIMCPPQIKSIRRKKGKQESTSDGLEISAPFYTWIQKCIATLEKRGLESEVRLLSRL